MTIKDLQKDIRYIIDEEIKHYQNDSMINMDRKKFLLKKEIDLF